MYQNQKELYDFLYPVHQNTSLHKSCEFIYHFLDNRLE